MPNSPKRFKSRRHWHNSALMFRATLFLLLIGIIHFAGTGRYMVLAVSLGTAALGTLVAFLRDASDRGTYQLIGDRLVLEGRKERAEYTLDEVLDVSLIDRAAAREFILTALRKKGVSGKLALRKEARAYLKFTSVDVGLTSFTLGIGRSMIDKMPDARHDLVLLRLRNGDTYFLSPEYPQDLVSSLTKRVLGQK